MLNVISKTKNIKQISFIQAKNVFNKLSKKEKILMNTYGDDINFYNDENVISRFGYFTKENNLVGFIELTDYKDGFVYIDLAILPKYRGQGIAYEMINYAEKFAKKNNYKQIRYVVNKNNVASQKLVQKLQGYNYSFDTLDCFIYDKKIF